MISCEAMTLSDFGTAPVQFRYTVRLPVTPDQLFEVLEDPHSWPKWAPGIAGVEWTSPRPYGPGTTRTVTFRGGIVIDEDFFVFEPGRELAFYLTGTTEPLWTAFGEHYRVEPTDGGCTLHWHVAYEPTGRFGALHPFVKPLMWLNLRMYMVLLRRYCRRRFREDR